MRPQTQSSNIQGAGITSRQADVAESAGTVCGHQESRGHLWARTVRTTDVLLVCKCFRLLCSVSAQASPQCLVLNKVASHNEQPNRWWWGVCLFSWESSLKHLPATFKCYFVCLLVCLWQSLITKFKLSWNSWSLCLSRLCSKFAGMHHQAKDCDTLLHFGIME